MDIEQSRYIPPGLRDQPFPNPSIKTPVRRDSPVPKSKKANELFKNSLQLDILNRQTGFAGGPQPKRKGHRLAAWSLLASVIDTLILVSISCVFLLVFSFVIHKTNLGGSIHLHLNRSLEKLFFVVFLMSSWIYMVTLRVLMGSSVGEWACDLRLGQPQERMKVQYPLKVIVRESLVLFTGIVTLPFLSVLWGRDIAGKLSGLELFSLK